LAGEGLIAEAIKLDTFIYDTELGHNESDFVPCELLGKSSDRSYQDNPMSQKVTLRDLAKHLGLSKTTVSESLRGLSRVNQKTRKRVQRAAEELGYRSNNLASAVMADLRRTQRNSFRGTLAVLDLDTNSRTAGALRYNKDVVKGAIRRADELGFTVDVIDKAAAGFPRERLQTILETRGVRGVLLLPMAHVEELVDFQITGFAAVYADYLVGKPALHSICPDHYFGLRLAMEKVQELGYRRPGFVIADVHDDRLHYRWEAAYQVFREHFAKPMGLDCLPICIVPHLPVGGFSAKHFTEWFKQSNCDVVLTHDPGVKSLMEKTGARVPETHGYCCLNVFNNSYECAGLNLRPELLGERAVELLIGQVLRNESGLPERPLATTMPMDWIDGPTLRNQR